MASSSRKASSLERALSGAVSKVLQQFHTSNDSESDEDDALPIRYNPPAKKKSVHCQ